MATDEARKDLAAAVGARRELGAEYEPEIIDAFLDRVDARIAERTGGQPAQQERFRPLPPPKDDPGGLALAIVSVVAGIPITGIAATQEGLLAIFVCWGGLVGINLARTVSRFVGR